jgi:hypothetical protein
VAASALATSAPPDGVEHRLRARRPLDLGQPERWQPRRPSCRLGDRPGSPTHPPAWPPGETSARSAARPQPGGERVQCRLGRVPAEADPESVHRCRSELGAVHARRQQKHAGVLQQRRAELLHAVGAQVAGVRDTPAGRRTPGEQLGELGEEAVEDRMTVSSRGETWETEVMMLLKLNLPHPRKTPHAGHHSRPGS